MISYIEFVKPTRVSNDDYNFDFSKTNKESVAHMIYKHYLPVQML